MVDLKALARSLAESGLMRKNFYTMSREEVTLVARLVHAASKKRCIRCDQWEKAPEAPWWVGKCRIGGHALQKESYCSLETDSPPF